MAMGKGIAVQLKKRFGNLENLKDQGATVGEAAVLDKPGSKDKAFVCTIS